MHRVTIDVREADEFNREIIAGSLHVPFSKLKANVYDLTAQTRDEDVLIMCNSGRKAHFARADLKSLCASAASVEVFEGGLEKWKATGLPTVIKERTQRLPVKRQLQLIAGALMLSSTVLGYFVNYRFLLIGGTVGAGLIFAGATGNCFMAEFLSGLSYKKISPSTLEQK